MPFKRSADLPLGAQPVVGLEDRYPSGFMDPLHAHEQCQLVLTLSGMMTVMTAHNSFILPPFRAMWIPASTHHQVTTRGTVHFHTLYIDNALRQWGANCRVFDTTPLVRALVGEILYFTHPYAPESREGRLTALLLDELDRMPELKLQVTMPKDPRLARICKAILSDATEMHDLDHWAREAAMGRRTFTRQFREQTGTSLAAWRQQARMVEAIALLEQGASVTEAAYGVGYDSPSAFSAVFRKIFGVAPSAYAGTRAAP
ncbi:transcriptional regulator [Gluconacetobacter liquefaciens]|nr:AraC family transcriptional regulator [Gluconacetobacter liquefaciens NRIC 0522]GEB37896.1 transcriptional regulator [Gluconacetobacter liquefaciens]